MSAIFEMEVGQKVGLTKCLVLEIVVEVWVEQSGSNRELFREFLRKRDLQDAEVWRDGSGMRVPCLLLFPVDLLFLFFLLKLVVFCLVAFVRVAKEMRIVDSVKVRANLVLDSFQEFFYFSLLSLVPLDSILSGV